MSDLETATDIVWLQTAFLGDIVLTTAAFEAARAARPHVRQHLITTPLGAKALAGEATLQSRIVFDKKGKGALAAFRDVKSALARALPAGARAVILQPHRSPRSSLLSRYLGLPTVTYVETKLGGHAHRVTRVATFHEATRIALLLEPLGVARQALVGARPRLTALALAADGGWQDRLRASSGPVVGIAPGSIWGTKRWTPQGFRELARRLTSRDAGMLVLLGSASEAAHTADIAGAVGLDAAVLDLAGKTSLDDLRRIYPRLSLLISNDSSPVHYASSFNVPTVAVFGSTVPEMGFGPLADKSATPGVRLSCRPCSDHGPQVCPLGHFKCMRTLSVDDVYAACSRILAHHSG